MHPLERGPTMDLLVLPTKPGNKLVGMIIKLKQKNIDPFLGTRNASFIGWCLYIHGHYSLCLYHFPNAHRFLIC